MGMNVDVNYGNADWENTYKSFKKLELLAPKFYKTMSVVAYNSARMNIV